MTHSDQTLSEDELQDFLDSVGVDPKKEFAPDTLLNAPPPLPSIEPTRYLRPGLPESNYPRFALWLSLGVLTIFTLGIGFGFFLGLQKVRQTPFSNNEIIEPTDPIPPLSEEEQLAPKKPA